MVKNEPRWLSAITGRDHTVTGQVTRIGLACMEPVYRMAVAVRNQLFDSGLRQSHKLPRPVISVGNLTTGGTGKTPLVIELAGRLIKAGHRHLAVLLRGYKAGVSGSDEARLIEAGLGSDVPVEAHPDRVQSAQKILARHPGINIFLLDDGFQHRRVHRDLDLVLIDATRPFGYGHVLPRGLLREPVVGLRRADAIVMTRCDRVSRADLEELDRQVEKITGHRPIAHTAHRWRQLLDINNRPQPVSTLKPARVLGVCGVGNPDAFAAMLAGSCNQVIAVRTYADHHAYTQSQIETILHEAVSCEADAVITTEKDWVKWKPIFDRLQVPVPVYRPVLHVEFLDGSESIDQLWGRLLIHPPSPSQ